MSTLRLLGRVKWFNNKAGYGFITVTDGERKDSDIFVHHSSIVVSNQQYKYLVQGEYVEFDLTATPGGAHEFQAAEVGGIRGGLLMCETRRDTRIAKGKPASEGDISEPIRMPRSVSMRGSGPREGADWTVVGSSSSSAQASPLVSEGGPANSNVTKRRGRPPRAVQTKQ